MNIECVIAGRIDSVRFDIKDTIGTIEDIVVKYAENPMHIQILGESSYSAHTIAELAVNFAAYLEELIREYNAQKKNEETG